MCFAKPCSPSSEQANPSCHRKLHFIAVAAAAFLGRIGQSTAETTGTESRPPQRGPRFAVR